MYFKSTEKYSRVTAWNSHSYSEANTALLRLFVYRGWGQKERSILPSFNVLTSCPLSSPLSQTHSMLYVCVKIISVPMTTCHSPSQALFSNSVMFNIETFKRTASEIKNVNSRACDFVIMQPLLFVHIHSHILQLMCSQ